MDVGRLMPWFRLDDSFHSHPKVLKAGNEAVGLYVRCGTYASDHTTDGFVDRPIVLLYGTEALAARLVDAGLWHRTRGGWNIHDYLDYNPSREAVEKERKDKAERQRRWREKQHVTGAGHGRDHSGTSRKVGPNYEPTPVDDAVGRGDGSSESRGRRVTGASSNASGDAAPTRPAPKEAGRGTRPGPPDGRAIPTVSPPGGRQDNKSVAEALRNGIEPGHRASPDAYEHGPELARKLLADRAKPP